MSDHENKKREEDRWWEDDPTPQDNTHENKQDSGGDKEPPEPDPEPDTPDDEPPKPKLTPGIRLSAFLEEASELFSDMDNSIGIFTIKTANEWVDEAKGLPIPEMLFGEFWYEGEVCILFADTNTGKSILAVQIADSITRGAAVPGFALEARVQAVAYLDFELFSKQFEARYSNNYAQHYKFSDRLHRVEINPEQDIPEEFRTMEDYLVHSMELVAQRTGIGVFIVDNITYLRSETERAKDALPLMKQLMALKRKYGISILALAHTPKRDMSKPLTRNDLSGSKMLMNYCDSCFCIGESVNDKRIRYLKQIKVRANEFKYDTNNVALCRIDKPHNFLQFVYTGTGAEKEHLAESREKDKSELVEECKRLKEEGMTYEQIAPKVGISKSTVERYVKS